MRRRWLAHIFVAALLLTGIEVDLVPRAAAAPVVDPKPERILSFTTPVDLPRATVTVRTPVRTTERTPLPTPVPIDPNATPLPGPTAEPVSNPSTHSNSSLLVWPVPAASGLNQLYSLAHPAIDIGAACGAAVLAPASGTVVYAAWKNNGGGYVIDIDAGWALISLNHLSGFAVGPGPVEQGQVVGYVGMTGLATGCHLHEMVLLDGWWTDPLAFH